MENELEFFEFKPVGEWKRSNLYKGIDFSLVKYKNQRVIYCFLVDNKPKYIGICEAKGTTLEKRMKNYRTHNGKTNKRIRDDCIKPALGTGKVEICAVIPKEKFKWKNLEVDPIAGLEQPLIEHFDTRAPKDVEDPNRWNKK